MLAEHEIDPDIRADIEKFEVQLARYLSGDLEEDAFRVFRLNNGIYGQRQGGHNQMVRVKVPYGVDHRPSSSTCWPTSPTPTAGAGATSRPARTCSSTSSTSSRSPRSCETWPRSASPPARRAATPSATSWAATSPAPAPTRPRHQPVGRGRVPALPPPPAGPAPPPQVQDQLLRLRDRLRPGDVQRRRRDRHHPHAARRHPRGRLPGVRGRWPRRQPARRAGPRGVHAPRGPHGHARGDPPGVLEPRQPRQQAPGPPEVGRRHEGWDVVQARILKERKLLVASSTWPGGIPEHVEKVGDAPAGLGAGVTPTVIGQGTPVTLRRTNPYDAWDDANVVRGAAKGTVSAIAYSELGDITTAQCRALASIQRELGAEVRITNRQNLVFRGLTESQLPTLHQRLDAIGMAEPGAELARDVVACPGADTCNLAVTQSRGLADAIGAALTEAGLAEVPRHPHQHLRLHQQLRPAPHRRHRLLRRRAPGPRPVGPGLPDAARRLRRPGEDPLRPEGPAPAGQERPRGGRAGGAALQRRAAGRRGLPRLDGPRRRRQGHRRGPQGPRRVPAPGRGPEYYVDYGETGPYVAETGESECAT